MTGVQAPHPGHTFGHFRSAAEPPNVSAAPARMASPSLVEFHFHPIPNSGAAAFPGRLPPRPPSSESVPVCEEVACCLIRGAREGQQHRRRFAMSPLPDDDHGASIEAAGGVQSLGSDAWTRPGPRS